MSRRAPTSKRLRALVLGVAVEELIEEEWRTTWLQLSADAPDRPTSPEQIRQGRVARERAYWELQ